MEESQELRAEQVQNGETAKEETAPSADAKRIAELEAQLALARQEAAENWNKFLRERADMDNFQAPGACSCRPSAAGKARTVSQDIGCNG